MRYVYYKSGYVGTDSYGVDTYRIELYANDSKTLSQNRPHHTREFTTILSYLEALKQLRDAGLVNHSSERDD